MISRLSRAPLVHFLVLGGTLLALHSWWFPEEMVSPRPRIVVDAAELARLREAWTDEHGAPPSSVAEDTLVRDAIDEEILYREALARGFDRQDEAVRERLVRLGNFVGEEGKRDRAALEREARRLGLERSDLVIRRHLVEMMRLATGSIGPNELPTREELEVFLAEHADDFTQPARVRLEQVYFSTDKRGPAATTDARTLLDELGRATVGLGDAAGRGDAFIRGAAIDATDAEVERIFGPTFAAAVASAPLRAWVGPVRSSYGLHLLWVDGREPRRTSPLDAVRGRVLHRWLSARSEERARAALDAMRARYEVDVVATPHS
jgi:peptidyl-prolyl cis-trans isomerase C